MKIDKLILGTVQLGLDYGINNSSGKPSSHQAFDILSLAATHGITCLDTAQVYGNAQQLIGDFHKRHKTFFKVNTKFKKTEVNIDEQVTRTLNELNVDKLNCLFFHNFQAFREMLENEPEYLEKIRETAIDKVGVSIYDNSEFEFTIECGVIDVIQLPFNILDNWSKRGRLIDRAKARGIEVQIRSVFLQGLFFKSVDELGPFFNPLKPYLERLHEIAKKAELSLSDLALQYAAGIDAIDQVLIGVESVDQLEYNLAIISDQLSEELKNEISAISIPVELEYLLNPSRWEIK